MSGEKRMSQVVIAQLDAALNANLKELRYGE